MKYVTIVGVIIEADSPDEAKAVLDKAMNAASDHTSIVSSRDAVTPWPCTVEPGFGEHLVGLMGNAIENSGKPIGWAIKKREGYSELVIETAPKL